MLRGGTARPRVALRGIAAYCGENDAENRTAPRGAGFGVNLSLIHI